MIFFILTDLTNNVFYLLILIFKKLKFMYIYMFVFNNDFNLPLNNGLKNSLFLIHPVLFFSYFIFFKNLSFFKNFIILFSFFLGGF